MFLSYVLRKEIADVIVMSNKELNGGKLRLMERGLEVGEMKGGMDVRLRELKHLSKKFYYF